MGKKWLVIKDTDNCTALIYGDVTSQRDLLGNKYDTTEILGSGLWDFKDGSYYFDGNCGNDVFSNSIDNIEEYAAELMDYNVYFMDRSNLLIGRGAETHTYHLLSKDYSKIYSEKELVEIKLVEDFPESVAYVYINDNLVFGGDFSNFQSEHTNIWHFGNFTNRFELCRQIQMRLGQYNIEFRRLTTDM